jgi:hypothetical protein
MAISAGEKLDGQTIRVAGLWRSSTGVGLFDELVDNKCSELGAIHVVFTGNGLQRPPPKGYTLDVRSARHAQSVTDKALADGRDVSATIKGVLYVQKRQDYVPAHRLPDGRTIPPPHKWYPLVMLVEAIPEITER